MTTDRQTFLAHIRNRISHREKPELATPRNWPSPAVAKGSREERIARFIAQSKAHKATIEHLADRQSVEGAVCDYLRTLNAPLQAVAAPALKGMDWTTLDVAFCTAGEGDRVSLSEPAFGIAETGTLAFFSGPKTPVLLNFAPEIEIAILSEDRIVGGYEDIWQRLNPAHMPRAVNFISGPSRTGDIEQTMYLGAHGPKHLHIILTGDQ